VELDIIGGNTTALTLSGNESDYTATINSAGSVVIRARQEGIADILLAAPEVEILVNINKKDLRVIAKDETRPEGQPNPEFTFLYDSFITGESAANLDVLPIATCVAGVLSPVGDYTISVTIDNDKNYNLIPVAGTLRVTRSEERVNAFTPYDEDDINDRFMQHYKLKIFNRYGVLIYETKTKMDEEQGWNGRFQNSNTLVNPGVYYYIAYDENGKAIRKGSVNVIKK
ncbi:MAG: gliding motility-associated C-terminal domain-containing protein, partial [Prevotellaceae bacterium]|jgi:gliding motility-associated-like protein|nr:gliding motility-associated C-terminal domain-containing protein [Prevotellaceae bacterium]